MAVGWLIFLVAVDTLHGKPGRVNLLALLFCLNAVAVCVVGIGEILNWAWAEKIISLFRTGPFFVGDTVRFSSTLEYPNTAAVFLTQALVLAAFLSLAGDHEKLFSLWSFRRSFWIPAFLIVAASLVLTYSRGAMVGGLVGLVTGGVLAWWFKEKQLAKGLAVALAAVVLVYFLMALFNPYLRLRGLSFEPLPFFRVEYELDKDFLSLKPAQKYSEKILLHNRGLMPLEANGSDPYYLSYLWYDAIQKRVVEEGKILTPLPGDLASKTSMTVNVGFRTPDREGEFVLLWDFFQKKNGWLSVRGIDRKMIPCSVYSDPANALEGRPRKALRGAVHYIQALDARKRAQSQYLSRRVIWKAAWRIFLERPWTGVGPGNFRLLYWKYLGIQYWDERIHANSLYLEFLADSGLIGTSLLILLLVGVLQAGLQAIHRSPDRQTRLLSLVLLGALLGWLAHSFFDYFLDFTPTYLLFWIWAGMLVALRASPAPTTTESRRPGFAGTQSRPTG